MPALTTVLLKNRKVKEVEPEFLVWLRARYLAALRVALALPDHDAARRPRRARVRRLRSSRKLGTEFLPEMNEGDIHITVTMPSAVSLERGAAGAARDARSRCSSSPR